MFHVFLVCSGLAAAVNLLVGYGLYGLAGLNSVPGYALSVSLAFLSGMGVSFVLNRRFTYRPSGRKTRHEMRDFFLVSVVGLLLTTGIAHVLNTGAGDILSAMVAGRIMPETLAHVTAVGLTAFYSFFAHKYISFRQARLAEDYGPMWPGQEMHAAASDKR